MPKVINESFETKCDFCNKNIEPTLHYKEPTEQWIYLACALCYTKASPFIAQTVEPDESPSV